MKPLFVSIVLAGSISLFAAAIAEAQKAPAAAAADDESEQLAMSSPRGSTLATINLSACLRQG